MYGWQVSKNDSNAGATERLTNSNYCSLIEYFLICQHVLKMYTPSRIELLHDLCNIINVRALCSYVIKLYVIRSCIIASKKPLLKNQPVDTCRTMVSHRSSDPFSFSFFVSGLVPAAIKITD